MSMALLTSMRCRPLAKDRIAAHRRFRDQEQAAQRQQYPGLAAGRGARARRHASRPASARTARPNLQGQDRAQQCPLPRGYPPTRATSRVR